MLPEIAPSPSVESPARGMRRILVLLATAGALAAGLVPTAARADLGVGEPAPFEPDPIAAIGAQSNPAAASNGSVTLFVWQDPRGIHGARVEDDGTVLDPDGILIAPTELSQAGGPLSRPSVASNGADWLVVWDTPNVILANDIHAARVAADGTVLDDPALYIAGNSFGGANAGVVWDGSLYVVAWASDTGPVDFRALTVDSDGAVHGPAVMIAPIGGASRHSMAALGGTVLFAYSGRHAGDTSDQVYAVRLTASTTAPVLTRLDANDIAVATDPGNQRDPAVAASGSEWLVVWEDAANAGVSGLDLRARRLDSAGGLLGASSFPIADEAGDDRVVDVVADGTGWLATWRNGTAAQYARRFAGAGAPASARLTIGTGPLPVGDGAGAIGGSGGGHVVAWGAPGAQDDDLFARTLASNDALGAPFVLATGTPSQTEPALAFGAGHWFVAWVDDRYQWDFFGYTVDSRQVRYAVTDGSQLAPPAPGSIAWVARRAGLDQAQPAVVFDGTNFQLFWSEERGGFRRIVGARFTAGGAPIDTFTVSQGAWNETEPTCGYSAFYNTVMVFWTDDRNGQRDIYGRAYVNGAPVDAEKLVISSPEDEAHPRVAFEQYGGRLVYERHVGTDSEVRFSYVNPGYFESLYSYSIAAEPGHWYEAPNVASNGYDFQYTWQELVDNDGPILHTPWTLWDSSDYYYSVPQQLGPASYTPARPVVASGGFSFVHAWGTLDGGQNDLVMRSVEPNQVPAGPAPLRVTNDPAPDGAPALAHGLGDELGFAFVKALDSPEWHGPRLYGGAARDTLVGKIVLNEILPNPPAGVDEFYELFNRTQRNFQLNGWRIVVNHESTYVTQCNEGRVRPGAALEPGARGGGPVGQGSQCGEIVSQAFYYDDYLQYSGLNPIPDQGYLPDRHGVIELLSPDGVVVDRMAYGDSGAAPSSPAIPIGEAPAAQAQWRAGAGPTTQAPGDSAALSTARLPNGTDTDNDGADWNLTSNPTPGADNSGTTATLGSALFVARVIWNPPNGEDAIELYNPSLTQSYNITDWYVGTTAWTQQIKHDPMLPNRLGPGQSMILRRGEPGSFSLDIDYEAVLYVFDDQLARVEQLAWWRPDGAMPESCATRVPETGGYHDGYDWFTSGGEQVYTVGQYRYTQCDIQSPTTGVGDGPRGPHVLAFAGARPNPSSSDLPAVLAFTVPGADGGGAVRVRLRIYNVAGRLLGTMVDDALAPGDHRVPLARRTDRGVNLSAGTYFAELEVGGQRRSRTVVLLP